MDIIWKSCAYKFFVGWHSDNICFGVVETPGISFIAKLLCNNEYTWCEFSVVTDFHCIDFSIFSD